MAASQGSSDTSIFKGLNPRIGYAIQLNEVLNIVKEDVVLPEEFWNGLDDFMKVYQRSMLGVLTQQSPKAVETA